VTGWVAVAESALNWGALSATAKFYSATCIVISERERMFTFAICYRRSVCRLSVIRNVRAPYSAGWNFRQFWFAVWYLGHPFTFTKNFTDIVPEEPRRLGGLNARGVAKYSHFGAFEAISYKRCKIGDKLVLVTNRKSYTSFRLVQKSVTLNDLERRNGPHFALFYRIW